MAQTKSAAQTKSPGGKSSGQSIGQKSSGRQESGSKASGSEASGQSKANTRQSASINARSENSGAAAGNSELAKFFEDCLKDIYWAEKHLLKALGKMKKAATTEELQQAIAGHREQTEGHVTRLEEVFEILGKKAQAKKCEAMEGLTKEGDEIVEETEDGSITRDVGIIVASQKIEHYEIATYGSLVQLAKVLGHEDVADILHTTLQEEKEADQKLTDIAEGSINWEAESEDDTADSKG